MESIYCSPLKPPDGVDEDNEDNDGTDTVTEESGKAFLETQKS